MVFYSPIQAATPKRVEVVAFDANYEKSPRGFYQIFFLYGRVDERMMWLGAAWMNRKNELSYRSVFEVSKSQDPGIVYREMHVFRRFSQSHLKSIGFATSCPISSKRREERCNDTSQIVGSEGSSAHSIIDKRRLEKRDN